MRQVLFNKPCIVGEELSYVSQAIHSGNIGGDGVFTKKCSHLLERRLGIHQVLMMPSCTSALEAAAMLCDLGAGDEVIVPSYTFVSTVNAFYLRGAKPVFVDVRPDTLNIDANIIEAAITAKTKAIFPVHYAGVACDMNRIMEIASEHGLWVVEDAAQGVNAFHEDRALGSIGHLGAYSFHETKNYTAGQGGALCVNSPTLCERAEIIRHKGTDRAKFFRGEADRYTWVDIGSAYVPSEITCAFLYGQLEHLEELTKKRQKIYETYAKYLEPLETRGLLRAPRIPKGCHSNYHIFYILLADVETRDEVSRYLLSKGIFTVFHYVPLHLSAMGAGLGYRLGDLPVTEELSARLLRLPLHYDLSTEDQLFVVDEIAHALERVRDGVSSSKPLIHRE